MSSEPTKAPWTRRDKVHATLLLLITAGAIGHHASMWFWFIEDAAISFAYSEHLALGEGLVPFDGGERVEGYSNPAWVFFLAPFYFVGLGDHMYEGVKWIQLLLTIATVPLTYLAAREACPKDSHAPVVAAAVLAANSQFALWGGAGLEMALMNVLFAGALWRSLVEVRTGRWPISALLWLGVTLCRPEAILYAAVAGFCAMVFHLQAGRGILPTIKWLVTFFLPYGLYQAWRYWYFAWEWPNTYYAKMERRKEAPFLDWSSKPWKYTRSFLLEMGWGFFLPVWVLGVMGHRRWRLPVAVLLIGVIGITAQLAANQRFLLHIVVGFMLLAFWIGLKVSEEDPPRWLAGTGLGVAVALIGLSELLRYQGMTPNQVPTPEWMANTPVYVLGLSAVLLPVLSLGTRGWQGRMLCFGHVVAAMVFALIAQWDWMNGYRWFAPASVPGAVLFAFGAESLASVVQEALSRVVDRFTAPGFLTLGVVTLAIVPVHSIHTKKIADTAQTTPKQILVRVNYVRALKERLHIEGRLVDLDVDQGGHVLWSDFEMLDIAGLIDVPLGHHKFERAFVQEYLFQEKKPHYAHVHGGWAGNSRIPTFSEWRSEYLEIPGYPANRSQMHIGNHIRRDLIMATEWPWDTPTLAIDGGIVLNGVAVPSEPGSGKNVYVEVGVSMTKPRATEDDDFRLVLFASDAKGHLKTWDIPPGYDWLLPHEWKPNEVFLGKFDLAIPESLPPGTYDLGWVVLDAEGAVKWPIATEPEDLPDGVVVGGLGEVEARFMPGEVRYPGTLHVLSVEERADEATADREAMFAAAAEGRCDDAVHSWWLARAHRPGEKEWVQQHEKVVHGALSTCYAVASDEAADRDERVRMLVQSREYDWWTPAYRERAKRLAQELFDEGLVAREARDWEKAYRLFADCVDVERSRSWCRRYAEEARAYRLGIDPESKAIAETDREKKREEARERRERLEKEKQEREEREEQEEREEPGAQDDEEVEE